MIRKRKLNPRFQTHTCDDLRASDVGAQATLSGWIHRIRDHGGLMFLDLRDHSGITQILVEPGSAVMETLRTLRVESVVTIDGIVQPRLPGTENGALATGEIELLAKNVEVQSEAEILPFSVADQSAVDETLRLRYRFLDLRTQRMHRNILLRSAIVSSLRRRMEEWGFVEIQTPILTSSSPEGARDFLIPSRLHPGKFYALPQAPQQFKQLLMVSGFDRYFQIATCFRDEAARSDRSPGEFTQLDLEMAFVEQEDVFEVVEDVLHGVFTEFSDWSITPVPFPRITYAEAMRRFGSDKPDLRLSFEIDDVTDLFRSTEFRVFRQAIDAGGVVRAIRLPELAEQPRRFFDELTTYAEANGGGGIAYVTMTAEGKVGGNIAKFVDDELASALCPVDGSTAMGCVMMTGPEKTVAKLMGALRLEIGRRLDLFERRAYRFLWVDDFPFYERSEETGAIEFSHNPFSMPRGGMAALDGQDPEKIVAHQYDIVCNGVELSSGAIRNHRPDIMYKAFAIAGYDADEVDRRFGGMIRAFKSGAPPHGGLAPGVDRMVMLLADVPSIREVTAFPMTSRAEDLLMGAPSEVSQQQLDELFIQLKLPKVPSSG